jgi:hypothetical protein
MNTKINLRFFVLAALILLAAFSRVIPHPVNFSPLGAIAIFAAAHFNKRWQILCIPILATWLSDIYINNVIYSRYYPTFTWFYEGFYFTYLSYILIAIFGLLLFKKLNFKRILIGILGSSVIFFIVSNLGCWVGNSFYPQNFSGLISCYIAGIPYITGTLLGDIFYGLILFGGFSIAQNQLPALRKIEY